MRLLLTATVALTLLLTAVPAAAQSTPFDDAMKKTSEQLLVGIEDQHPAVYYLLAGKLFDEGRKEEAVFWFYAGQLRYRFMLAARPDLDPSGDPAAFASLTQSVGAPINEWAFGDLDAMQKTLNGVLAWDEKTSNGFTSKADHAEAWSSTREGMKSMIKYIADNAEQIRAQRKSNGLENRN